MPSWLDQAMTEFWASKDSVNRYQDVEGMSRLSPYKAGQLGRQWWNQEKVDNDRSKLEIFLDKINNFIIEII